MGYDANLRAEKIKNTRDSMNFTVQMPGKSLDIKTHLRGNFNVSNILAAIGVFAALGIDRETIPQIVSEIK